MHTLLKPKLLAAVLVAGLAVSAPVRALMISEIPGAVLGISTSAAFPYPTGSLVKDGGTIYFISGTVKVPFTNYRAFTGLGYSLKNVVSGDLSNYSASQTYVISTANDAHPWGSWLSYKNTIYYSAQDGLVGVPSAAVFAGNGGQWKFVVKANKYDIAVLNANPNLPALTENDSRVQTAPQVAFNTTSSGTNSQEGNQNNNSSASGSGGAAAAAVQPAVWTGTLNPPTLSSSSPVSQFVFGSSTNQPIAAYHFSSSGGQVLITELDMAVSYPSTLPFPPVSTFNIGGVTAPLVVNSSTVANLSLAVSNSGTDIPVSVNYQAVGPNNIPANQPFNVSLAGVKYFSNNTTTIMSVNLPANTMNMVASAPTVNLSSGGQTLTDNTVLVAKVTVTGNSGGNFVLNQIPLTFTSTGGATVIATSSNMWVTDDNGGIPVPVSYSGSGVGLASSSSASITVTFNGDNTFNGNVSRTYDFYLPVIGALGNSGNSAITTKLGASSGFIFSDVAGGQNNIPGGSGGVNYIHNYPTASVSVNN